METQSLPHTDQSRRQNHVDGLRCALFTPKWPAKGASNGIVTYVSVLNDQLRIDGHQPVIVLQAGGLADGGAGDDEVVQWLPRHGPGGRLGTRLAGLFGAESSKLHAQRTGRGIAHALTSPEGAGGVDLLEMEETFGLAGYVAEQVDFPVVVRLHGPWFLNGSANGVKRDRAFEKRVAVEGKAIEAAFAVTACSANVLEETRAYYNLELPNAAVIPNPSPAYSSDQRWSADDADPDTVLFVGRFDRHKGGDTMLLAFQQVAEQFPQARLVFIGPDPGIRHGSDEVVKFAEFAAKHLDESVLQRIDYLGKMETTEIETWRRRAAVTVIASSFDNFPYSALESVAAGCPVVATRVGGIPEIVRDGETGLLVPPDDPGEMAEAIGRILSDVGFAARLGSAAAVDAEARFHPRAVVRETVTFYRDVIAKWKAGR